MPELNFGHGPSLPFSPSPSHRHSIHPHPIPSTLVNILTPATINSTWLHVQFQFFTISVSCLQVATVHTPLLLCLHLTNHTVKKN